MADLKLNIYNGKEIEKTYVAEEFDIMFGQGISREGDVLDLAANVGIIIKSGAWYAYNDAKIGQGRENAKVYLKENPDVFNEIEQKVREKYSLDQAPASSKNSSKEEEEE